MFYYQFGCIYNRPKKALIPGTHNRSTKMSYGPAPKFLRVVFVRRQPRTPYNLGSRISNITPLEFVHWISEKKFRCSIIGIVKTVNK